MYVIRIQAKPKSLSYFPANWPRITDNVIMLATKDSFQFDQLKRHNKVVHLTQLDLVSGEISVYSSQQ